LTPPNNNQVRTTQLIVATVILTLGMVPAYFLWPTGITELSLSAAPIGALLRAISAIVTGIAAVIFALLVAI
jgi:hypothetical protein